MLRVTVELLPYGIVAARRTLHLVDIADVGGTPEVADYAFRVATLDAQGRRHWSRTYRHRGHRRADGALGLLAAILAAHRGGPRERGACHWPAGR